MPSIDMSQNPLPPTPFPETQAEKFSHPLDVPRHLKLSVLSASSKPAALPVFLSQCTVALKGRSTKLAHLSDLVFAPSGEDKLI